MIWWRRRGTDVAQTWHRRGPTSPNLSTVDASNMYAWVKAAKLNFINAGVNADWALVVIQGTAVAHWHSQVDFYERLVGISSVLLQCTRFKEKYFLAKSQSFSTCQQKRQTEICLLQQRLRYLWHTSSFRFQVRTCLSSSKLAKHDLKLIDWQLSICHLKSYTAANWNLFQVAGRQDSMIDYSINLINLNNTSESGVFSKCSLDPICITRA